jgi:predicted DNA-binding transcriptional regulator AlpA
MEKSLLVTLTTTELRSLIAEVVGDQLAQVVHTPTDSTESPTLLSRLQVAALFGVSKTTIDKWRRYRILPPEVKIASRVYFYKEQIMELVKQRQRNPDLFNSF